MGLESAATGCDSWCFTLVQVAVVDVLGESPWQADASGYWNKGIFSVNGTSFSDIFEYKQMEITVKP